MDVSQLRRLKQLEGENAKLKKMYAELALVRYALQDVMSKKTLSQAQRLSMCLAMQMEHGVSLPRSLTALRLSRAAPYSKPRRRNDNLLIEAMTAYLADNPGQSFGLLYEALRANGHPWGKTRLWRVYCALKMNLPRRRERQLSARPVPCMLRPVNLESTVSCGTDHGLKKRAPNGIRQSIKRRQHQQRQQGR